MNENEATLKTQLETKLDPQIPIKLKLYLTKKERQAYRLAANLVNKESIADYLAHAIQTYTAFLLQELQTQVAARNSEEAKDVPDTTNQNA
jgi:hypothetical protein